MHLRCREATSQHAMGDEWTPCPAIPGTITGIPLTYLNHDMHFNIAQCYIDVL